MLEPQNVTSTSFRAHWRNVRFPWDSKTEPIVFKLITTREIEATKDGEYAIASPVIKGSTGDKVGKAVSKATTLPGWLDEAFSQPNWMGLSCYYTEKGVTIDTKDIATEIPEEMIGALARIQSPLMDLSNNKGEFTVTFKLRNASNKEASLEFFAYGEELQDPNKAVSNDNIKRLAVPNDGEVHTFSYKMKNGSWCHMLVLALKARGSVEVVEGIKVTQLLKKGDRAFRGTGRYEIDYDVTEHDERLANEPHKMNYYFNVSEGLNPIALDNEKAKADGERIAYRMSYSQKSSLHSFDAFERSLYSKPVYFDKNEDPSTSDQYIYVGYGNYVAPFYDRAFPSNSSQAQLEMAAAATFKGEMLKDYTGAEIVGVRVALAASRQPNFVFEPVAWNPQIPFIFITHKLRTFKNENEVPETIFDVKTPTGKLVDGWNTLMFDKPYEIKENDVLTAGIDLMDSGAGLGFLLHPDRSTKGKNPEVALYSLNTYGQESKFMRYMPFDENDCFPLLLQLIIKPKKLTPEQANRGELLSLEAKDVYYKPKWKANMTVVLNNLGTEAIKKAKFEIAFGDKKITKELAPAQAIAAGKSKSLVIDDIDVSAYTGKMNLTVSLVAVNDVTLATPSSLSQPISVVDIADVYPRTSLIELITSENCPNCPEVDESFFKDFRDGELSKDLDDIRKRSVVVSHHSVFHTPDFLTTQYAKDINDFYVNGSFFPAMMIDRTTNKFIKHANDNEPLVIGSVVRGVNYKPAMNNTLFLNPAFGRITLTKEYDAATKKMTVKVNGEVSKAIDDSRGIYVTFLVTQDKIQSRNQQNISNRDPKGFVHRYALRYASDPIKISDLKNGKFELSTIIPINTVGNGDEMHDGEFTLEAGGDDITIGDL